jgi:hypothetical protein
MDGANFELEKETLASEMEELDRAHTLKKRLREITGDDKLVMGKIRAFLLDPCLAGLLEERLTLLAGNRRMKVVNLDEVSPAPSCKDGGCAVKD